MFLHKHFARPATALMVAAVGVALFALPATALSTGSLGIPSEHQISRGETSSPSGLLVVENVGQWAEAARFQVWGSPVGVGTTWLAENAIWISVITESQVAQSPGVARHPGALAEWAEQSGGSPVAGHKILEDRLPTPPPAHLQPVTSPSTGLALKLTFPGSNPDVHIEPFEPLTTTVSYFIGNDPEQWRPAVPVWGSVRYADLYPGVDLVLGGRDGDWRLEGAPGAAVEQVRVQVEGAEILTVDGAMVRLAMEEQSLDLVLPKASFAYHVEGISAQGDMLARDVHPSVNPLPQSTAPDDNPGALIYSTYLGGTGQEYQGGALAVDATGRVVVAGGTESSNFPTTPGAFDPSFTSGHWNAFVVRLSANGSTLDYATFLGGSGSSGGLALALDAVGRATVTGFTDSSDFPTTAGAFDPDYSGDLDAFVLVLGADGSAIDYATFLGGSGYDVGEDLALDAAGSVTVTGDTRSSDFPTTPGAFDTGYNGGNCDTFVVKLNPAGSDLVYATFLGGSYDEYGFAVALDSAGRATVTGFTWSSDFPTTPGAFDTIHGRWYSTDAFVVRFDANGAALDYATLLGGGGFEVAYGLALDANGCATVTGYTTSSDFPITPGAFDTSFSGSSSDVFVLQLSVDGSTLNYATFLGGYGSAAEGRDLVLDADGSAVVTGYAYYDFPTTPGAFDRSYNGANCQTYTTGPCIDCFLARLNGEGSMLVYSTYLGGTNDNSGMAVALDAESRAVVMGYTYSGDFPTTPGVFDPSYNGGNCGGYRCADVFVTKLDASNVVAPIEQPLPGAFITNTVTLSGFAIDLASPTGTGIDRVHIYLDGPTGSGTMIGQAAYGLDRPDLAAQYGARFGPSGWQLLWDTSSLAHGVHELYVYVHRTTDNAWSQLPPHQVIVRADHVYWLPVASRNL